VRRVQLIRYKKYFYIFCIFKKEEVSYDASDRLDTKTNFIIIVF